MRHAFRVAASLDSMVIGEPQILGQVKEAYDLAEAAGALGAVLNALRNRSVAAAKRARTETGIGRNAVSVSSVAVELARKIFGDLRDRQVLLVGAGQDERAGGPPPGGRRGAGHRARRAPLRAGGGAGGRPRRTGGSLREPARRSCARAEIVISGTGAPGIVIGRADVEAALPVAAAAGPSSSSTSRCPRDVDPEVRKLSGVFLYDLDDLRSVADANLRERRKEASAAEALVEQEVLEFLAWRRSLDAVPLLVELRRRGDEIRRVEIERARRRLGTLTPEQEEAIDAATTAIVNKLLHPPTVVLKELAKNGDSAAELGLIRRLLGLGGRAGQGGESMKIRIGTRGSALARWQAEHVKGRLWSPRSRGGRSTSSPPPATARRARSRPWEARAPS